VFLTVRESRAKAGLHGRKAVGQVRALKFPRKKPIDGLADKVGNGTIAAGRKSAQSRLLVVVEVNLPSGHRHVRLSTNIHRGVCLAGPWIPARSGTHLKRLRGGFFALKRHEPIHLAEPRLYHIVVIASSRVRKESRNPGP